MNYSSLLQKKKTMRGGFTLVEALIAISILLIAVEGPMVIAQKGLLTATASEDQSTASFLAEDGMEAVKNMRDTTALNAVAGGGGDWLAAFDGATNCMCTSQASCAAFANYCNVNTLTDPPTLYASTSTSVNPLEISRNGSGNFLGFVLATAGTTNSGFSRKIDIFKSPAGNANEAQVNVNVSWNTTAGTQSITLTDYMYNYSANL